MRVGYWSYPLLLCGSQIVVLAAVGLILWTRLYLCLVHRCLEFLYFLGGSFFDKYVVSLPIFFVWYSWKTILSDINMATPACFEFASICLECLFFFHPFMLRWSLSLLMYVFFGGGDAVEGWMLTKIQSVSLYICFEKIETIDVESYHRATSVDSYCSVVVWVYFYLLIYLSLNTLCNFLGEINFFRLKLSF